MIQKLTILFGLIVSATCMVLHQAPLPLYVPLQEQAPSYNFGYETNNAHTGDYKSQQENRQGDAVLSQYSLLHPDSLTRTVDYRADDHSDFNAQINNDRRQNNAGERLGDNTNDDARRPNNGVSQASQPWSTPNTQHPSHLPVTITQTLVHHQTYSHGHKPWN